MRVDGAVCGTSIHSHMHACTWRWRITTTNIKFEYTHVHAYQVEMEAEQQGWRQELIETVVREELGEEAVRIMARRRGGLILLAFTREWRRYHHSSLRQAEDDRKARAHCLTQVRFCVLVIHASTCRHMCTYILWCASRVVFDR